MTVDPARLAAEAAQVEAARADPARFDELYEANVDAVYAFAARRLGNRADAEDVTSLVFQKALAGLPRYEWRDVPFVAWLLTIARNEVARRTGGRRQLEEVRDVPVDDDELEEVERRALLFRLLRLLPADQRTVLTLRFAHDRSIQQVATELGRSEGAVKQLQFRALQTLRAQRGALDA